MNGSNIKVNQIEALERRIAEIESRNAMRDLVSNYCHGFDRRDWDCFIGIWHEDAVWDIGPLFGEFHGHEGIRKAVQEILYPVWRESHHLTTNLCITFIDDDHAKGISNVDCMGANPDDEVQMVGATYLDQFERRQGVWKIAHRAVEIHYFNPMPAMEMSKPW